MSSETQNEKKEENKEDSEVTKNVDEKVEESKETSKTNNSLVEDYKKPYYDKIFGDEEDVIISFKSIVYSIIKQLSIGLDMSKIMLPVELMEPRSLLEKLTDICTHIDILLPISKIKSDELRMIEIVRFMISGWYIRTKCPRKPTNPVLGEVFRARWIMNDSSISSYFSEQVSHHPPISAFYGENKESGLRMEGFYHPNAKFLGNSAAALADGYAKLHIDAFDETYVCTWPDYIFRGFFFGTLRLELAGTIKIHCKKTGYSAAITFKQKPTFGGDWFIVEGNISKGDEQLYRIGGKWTEKLGIMSVKKDDEENGKWKLFFNTKDTKRVPIQWPRKNLKEFESHRLWKDLFDGITENDIKKARDAKHSVEQKQRVERTERAEKNIIYKQRYFRRQDDGFWEFIAKDDDMYKMLWKKKLDEKK